MSLSFDHLVHMVNDPEEAVDEFKKIGLQANLGGRHEKWGTYNGLSYFGLSYIEFLGIFNREIANEVPDNDLVVQTAKRLPNQQGFARIALRTDDIKQLANELESKNVKVSGPIKAERKREDGKILRWQMLFINELIGQLPYPFFIQWDEDDQTRLNEIKEKGSNEIQLKELIFSLEEHDKMAKKWAELLQLELSEPYIDELLKIECIKLNLEGCNLVFASSNSESNHSNNIEKGPFSLRIIQPSIRLKKEIFGGEYHFVHQ